MNKSPAVLGLQYIASSLPERYDGYSEETIAIAKAALEQIAELEVELARVKAEKWFVTDLDKVKEERDEWKAVAERLSYYAWHGANCPYEGNGKCDCDYPQSLAEFDRLQAKST